MYVRAPRLRLRRPGARMRLARSTGLSGLGYYESAHGSQLAGFGSSLRKGVKKIGRGIKKAIPKIAKFAAPVAGFVFAGPLGAAAGGALARGVQPGGFNFKLAARGAVQAGLTGAAIVGAVKAAPFVKGAFAAKGAAAAAGSKVLGAAVAIAKPAAITFARDLLTAKIMGSRSEEIAAAGVDPDAPTYYPYPVYDQAGNIVGTGAVPAGGGGFLEPGQTVDESLVPGDESPTESKIGPMVPVLLIGGLALLVMARK